MAKCGEAAMAASTASIDDGNEPAPENAPVQGGLPVQNVFSTWGNADAHCRKMQGANNALSPLKTFTHGAAPSALQAWEFFPSSSGKHLLML